MEQQEGERRQRQVELVQSSYNVLAQLEVADARDRITCGDLVRRVLQDRSQVMQLWPILWSLLMLGKLLSVIEAAWSALSLIDGKTFHEIWWWPGPMNDVTTKGRPDAPLHDMLTHTCLH
jgi:hypothetical protein